MDLTGQFPYTSSRGNQYIVVVYDFDSNAIVCAPLKTRQSKDILNCFKKCEEKFTQYGSTPSLYILDNEASSDLKLSLTKNNQQYELVPPNIHQRNTAEKAIRTFKNHFLSGLASCNPNFPIQEWDRLLPQCEITLNLLQNSRTSPKLSAWAAISGIHNFVKHPMTPPGTKILIHSKPNKRASWAFHGQEGWYVGPTTEHYRCVRCYLPKTHTEVVSDTVKFIPQHIPIPAAHIDDHIQNSLEILTNILTTKITTYPPNIMSETHRQALLTLAKIFQRDSSPQISDVSSSEGVKKQANTKAPTHHQIPKTKPKQVPMSDNEFS